jgi:hypothetical protein
MDVLMCIAGLMMGVGRTEKTKLLTKVAKDQESKMVEKTGASVR